MNQQSNTNKAINTQILKTGKRTYFFDVKQASNNRKYLRITESTFEGEGKDRKYNSFLLFPEQVAEFQQKLAESVNHLA